MMDVRQRVIGDSMKVCVMLLRKQIPLVQTKDSFLEETASSEVQEGEGD